MIMWGAEIIVLYFFFPFYIFIALSLSDRSRKAGAKNRQLPNERQLSDDQLQEGQCIRCNRPMSTVSPFQRLLLAPSLPRCNYSYEKQREREKREARVPLVSFAGRY